MLKKSKIIFLVTFACLLSFILIACNKSSFIIKNGKINHKDNEYYGSYDSFDGYTGYKIGNKNTIQIKYEIITESGELEIEINNELDENIVSINTAGTDEILVDNYLGNTLFLRINAKKHKGSYRVKLTSE